MCEVTRIGLQRTFGRDLYVVTRCAEGILIEVRHSNAAVTRAIRSNRDNPGFFLQWRPTDAITAKKWLAQIASEYSSEFSDGRVKFCLCNCSAFPALPARIKTGWPKREVRARTCPADEIPEFSLSQLEQILLRRNGNPGLLDRLWTRRVPLFNHTNLTVNTTVASRRILLCRSADMENLLGSAAVKLRDATTENAPKYLSIIYLLLSERPAPRFFYVGICRRWGMQGQTISANIRNVNPKPAGGWRGLSQFARWGDGQDWHIGQLSDSLFARTGAHADWAAKLFERASPPKLKREVWFSCFLIRNNGELAGDGVADAKTDRLVRDVETRLIRKLQEAGLHTLNKKGGDKVMERNNMTVSNCKSAKKNVKVVIQCAGLKVPGALTLALNGVDRKFVARPELAGRKGSAPWDEIGAGNRTFIDFVRDYNRGDVGYYGRVAVANGGSLTAAGSLYRNRIYQELLTACSVENVYILSAGWGLVRANDEIPVYDITFSQNAQEMNRITPDDRAQHGTVRDAVDGCEEIHLFLSRSYADYWFLVFPELNGRVILHWRMGQEHPLNNVHVIEHDCGNMRTNWQNTAAGQWLNGFLNA